MLKLIRLTASVTLLTSGVWLATAFVSGLRAPAERAVVTTAEPADGPLGGGGGHRIRPVEMGAPSLLPDSQPAVDAIADRAQESLAMLGPLLEATSSPPPFEPLPPAPREISSLPPVLEVMYRPALDLPPPPLLDAHAPPPLPGGASWHRQGPGEPLLPGVDASRPPTKEVSTIVPPPRTYVVRDGDDLTTIAGRLYGDPSAARQLWLANRDRLPEADVLPIGLTLVVPPVSIATSRERRLGGWIEPPVTP